MRYRPELSFMLLTWNRAPMLELCLESFFSNISGKMSYELIILDNASSDGTAKILDQYEGRPYVKIVRSKVNYRLNGYKKLFSMAKGRIMVELDDDVIRLPKDFDQAFVDYFKAFPDYGYIGLNVEQNELTNGAKPPQADYTEDIRGEKIIEEGPVGGWCSAFYGWHYRICCLLLNHLEMSMARGEDGILSALVTKVFRKRKGLIKNAVCLHATGPEYAREFGLLNREREKYMVSGLDELASRF